jgi:hypothetical protein
MFAATKHFTTAVSGVVKGSYLFSSSYLSLPSAATPFSFPGDFTIEHWLRPTSTSFYPLTFSTVSNYTTSNGFRIYMDAYSSNIGIASGGSAILAASTALTLNVWTHVAVVRSGSTITIYQGGSSVGSLSNSTSFIGDAPVIGNVAGAGGPYYWPGYVSNLRVVKGTAVYTSSFTPPTTPLTAISGTQLLTCQSPTTIIDASTNNYTLTNTGGTTASALSPF